MTALSLNHKSPCPSARQGLLFIKLFTCFYKRMRVFDILPLTLDDNVQMFDI